MHELVVRALMHAPETAVVASVLSGALAWGIGRRMRPTARLRASIVLAGAAIAMFVMAPSVYTTPDVGAALLPAEMVPGIVLGLLSVPVFMAAVVLAALSVGRDARAVAGPRDPSPGAPAAEAPRGDGGSERTVAQGPVDGS